MKNIETKEVTESKMHVLIWEEIQLLQNTHDISII